MKTKFLYNLLGLALILACSEIANAQIYANVTAGAGANIVRAKKTDANVIGNPFLFDKWVGGTIKFANGNMIKAQELNYDALEDVLVVKDASGQEGTYNDPVSEFTLNTAQGNITFKNGFTGASFTDKSFFHVISDGKTKLLERQKKVILESKGYNSASVTKKIEEDFSFYIAKTDRKAIAVKRNEKSILSVLDDKKEELNKFIKENKLNLKDTEDIAKLLVYYDSLFTP